MRRGARLGVDVGSVRVGVARSDPDGLLATPLQTVPRDAANGADLRIVAELTREMAAVEVVVGLPLSMDGTERAAAGTARAWATAFAAQIDIPVRLVDERLSTVDAQRSLRAAGRTTRGSRSVIDQQAAVVILQGALDAERRLGHAPGEVLGFRDADAAHADTPSPAEGPTG